FRDKFSPSFQRSADVCKRDLLLFRIDPMQDGVGKYRVVKSICRKFGYISSEKFYFRKQPFRFFELGFRSVHTFGVVTERSQICRKLSPSASQIEHARSFARAQKRNECFPVFSDKREFFAVFVCF